jgi:hypothetical protein
MKEQTEYVTQYSSPLLIRTTEVMRQQIDEASAGLCSRNSWVRQAIQEKLRRDHRDDAA